MSKELKNEEIEFQIQFYKGILKRKPDFIEALVALGDLYTKKGYYEEGLDIDRKLARLRPYSSNVLYNLACSYSLLNELPKALEAIQKAIECGYDDFEHLNKDPDLSNLRSDENFQKYFSDVKSKQPTKSKNSEL